MRFVPFATIAALPLVLLVACGSDDRAPALSDPGGPSNTPGSTNSEFCKSYCTTLVEQAPGCALYDENTRCQRICGFYMVSVCKGPYESFASCMNDPGSASCALPDDGSGHNTNGGKWTLEVRRCHEEYDEWTSCIDEKNASVCPY